MNGALQHLGGDKWRVRVYAGLDPVTGKQRARSKSFRATGKRAAERAAAIHVATLQGDIEERAAARGSMADLAERWLDLKRRQGRAPSTVEGYERIIERIVERFGHRRVADVRGVDIDEWYGELLAERDRATKQPVRSAATVQHYHSVLRAMLRQAEKWEMVDTVATRRASPPPAAKPEIKPPTTAALRVVLAEAGAGDFGTALRVIVGTGVRRGELCGLHWSDLNGAELTVRRSVTELKGRDLHIGTTKGKRPRTYTVGDDVLEAIADQRRLLEARAAAMEVTLPVDGPIWADLRADPSGRTPRRPGWVSHRWAELRARHGMDTVRLHDLRHWNATTMIDLGVPIAVVSDRMGHAQVSTTLNIYTHRVDASDRAAAAILTGAIGPGATVSP